MKKLFISSLLVSAIVCAPAIHADDDMLATEEVSAYDDYDDIEEEEEGTSVSAPSNEGAKAARKKRWQNIALAVGAVAVAVTAMLVVANHD